MSAILKALLLISLTVTISAQLLTCDIKTLMVQSAVDTCVLACGKLASGTTSSVTAPASCATANFKADCLSAGLGSGGASTASCWAVKATGWKCCVQQTTASLVGIKSVVNVCLAKDMSSSATTAGSTGLAGVATYDVVEICSASKLVISFLLAALMMILA